MQMLTDNLKPSEEYKIKLFETSLAYEITINTQLVIDRLKQSLKDEQIAIISAEAENGKATVKIGFSGIESENIEYAVKKLCSIISECKA